MGQRRARTPHYVTENAVVGGDNRDDEQKKKKKSLRASIDDPSFIEKKRDEIKNLEKQRIDQGYIRLRNERLERLEQPLIAGDNWRDVFSGDPALGKPSSTISGPWQVSAFALLGMVVVLSAIFLHLVAENNSDNNQSPYGTYRRRQRHARRMYKTRKKKTDEWSDDEEDLILQNGAKLPDHQASGAAVAQPQGDDTQFHPYYYDQGASVVPAAPPAVPGFPAQEHRQRRTSVKEPHTPPSASASGGRSTYYLPVNPTYKSPSANIMNMSGVHRRGITPGNSFNSQKSAGKSPGPTIRSTTSIGGGYTSSGGVAPSPSHIMRATAPLSGRLRVPTTPDGKDLFPSLNHSMSSGSHGLHHGLHSSLPTPPEGSQLPASEAQRFGNPAMSMHGGKHELGARPLNSSNFSSFASMDGSGDERGNSRSRSSSNDMPLSGSFRVGDLMQTYSMGVNSHGSQHLQHASHHRNLMLSPGNYDAETPQIGNRKVLNSRDFGHAIMPDMNDALMPPGGGSPNMPFIPALELSQHGFNQPVSPPLLYAASRPPRSVLLDELRIVQMETGNSTHWAVREDVSDSQDASDSHSFQGDDSLADLQGGTMATFDDDSGSEEGSDIPIPSGDPRGGIKHKRPNLTEDTNAYKSLQSNIDFDELKLEEVIGGGGFGQVWRATWFGTPVAVKVLTGSAQNTHIAKAILEEFKAEINLLKGMRHPNICLYMGACVRPPNRAIVTELAANGSVWDALRLPLSPPYVPADGTARGCWPLALYLPGQHGAPPSDVGGSPRVSAPIPPKGTWPWQLVKRVASGAARGMAYLHHGNPPVLHRDLKSANLLLDDSYTAKVCDFGLSRLKAQARSMTGNCGTVQWMAPEVLANMSYDEKADVFSYGIILWELLSRECPYEGMTAIQCALAVLNRDKRPEIPKWCPPSFHALIKSCVKKDPTERPSFSQVILALDAMEA